jgi:hypothetical protein
MVDAGFLVQELDANVGGGILAGALAFRIFLFMVPFLYVVFTVLGTIARAMGQDPAHVARNAGITGILATAVVKVDEQSAWTQAVLVLGAIVTLFITSGALMKALYVVHWLAYRAVGRLPVRPAKVGRGQARGRHPGRDPARAGRSPGDLYCQPARCARVHQPEQRPHAGWQLPAPGGAPRWPRRACPRCTFMTFAILATRSVR